MKPELTISGSQCNNGVLIYKNVPLGIEEYREIIERLDISFQAVARH